MKWESLFREFVSYAEKENLPIEGIAVANAKELLLEHHFTFDIDRNIYSHTKSFLATAIGIAIGEGKLHLEDKFVDFFPEYLPVDPDPRLLKITLRHFLTMSSGFNHAYLMGEDRRAGVGAPDYISYMMNLPMEKEPGELFTYSSADSIVAGRMLEKAVGKGLGEYLFEKVFSKLDIGWPLWEHDAQGHAVGCGGLFLKLADMIKLGQLYLADGIWKGERIVDSQWIKEATSVQIQTSDDGDIWKCGYGYQFWKSPYGDAYRADGAYGQITTIFPEKGLAISVQCPEDGNFDPVKKALHERLFLQL